MHLSYRCMKGESAQLTEPAHALHAMRALQLLGMQLECDRGVHATSSNPS
jgi:hypothetical protein